MYDCIIVLLVYNVEVGRERGVALGKDLAVKEMLQTLHEVDVRGEIHLLCLSQLAVLWFMTWSCDPIPWCTNQY